MMNVLLLQFNVIHLRNFSGVCLHYSCRSYANVYVSAYNGCLASYDV